MTWDEFKNRQSNVALEIPKREITDITCPNCGKYLWKNLEVLYTSIPPQYKYECLSCYWVGFSPK